MNNSSSCESPGILVNHPVFFSDFNETSFFSKDFIKNSHIKFHVKVRPVEAELFHPLRRTYGRSWQTQQSLFEILRTRMKTKYLINNNNEHTCTCNRTEVQWGDTEIFRKPRRDLKIPNSSSATWPNFHTQHPHILIITVRNLVAWSADHSPRFQL